MATTFKFLDQDKITLTGGGTASGTIFTATTKTVISVIAYFFNYDSGGGNFKIYAVKSGESIDDKNTIYWAKPADDQAGEIGRGIVLETGDFISASMTTYTGTNYLGVSVFGVEIT